MIVHPDDLLQASLLAVPGLRDETDVHVQLLHHDLELLLLVVDAARVEVDHYRQLAGSQDLLYT